MTAYLAPPLTFVAIVLTALALASPAPLAAGF